VQNVNRLKQNDLIQKALLSTAQIEAFCTCSGATTQLLINR
jgi:hypothetical protein